MQTIAPLKLLFANNFKCLCLCNDGPAPMTMAELLTFLDSFILLSYFYTGIATILCVSSYVRKHETGEEISRVDKHAQWFGPVSYFGILFSLLIYFYNFKGALSLLASIVS